MTTGKAVRRRASKKGALRPARASTPEASGHDKALFTIIGKRLKSSSKRRTYIPPEQIARALRRNPGVPLPPEIHDYLCDFLEGKIPAPAGRRADIEKPLSQIEKALIPPIYARYIAWLQRRKRSMGLEGWRLIREADWWQGPPNERAARMTCRRLRLAKDWRRVQNLVSEANKKRWASQKPAKPSQE
jgi:hypothetical protein